jgi:hypothetical protein
METENDLLIEGQENKAKQELDDSSDSLDYTNVQLGCSLRTNDGNFQQPFTSSNRHYLSDLRVDDKINTEIDLTERGRKDMDLTVKVVGSCKL